VHSIAAGTWEYGVTTMYLDGVYQQGLVMLSYGLSRMGKQIAPESAVASRLLVADVSGPGA
jgi:hypothetical protein